MDLSKTKTIWLLQWPEPWADGHGYTTESCAYESLETAIEAGHEAIRKTFSEDTEEEIQRGFVIFDHVRDEGERYCGGVNLRPIVLLTE